MPQLDILESMKSTMRYRPAKGMDAMVPNALLFWLSILPRPP